MKFGKLPPEYDERTIQFSKLMDPSFHAPSKFDFDKGRTPLEIQDWGSTRYRTDVIAAQANQLLRMGRIDQRRTIPLDQQDVIRRYKRLAGVKKLGDSNDIGITMLEGLRAWKQGWTIRGRTYGLAMYGEVEPLERDLIRTLVYVFRGVHFGLWLPKAVQGEFHEWKWDGENGDKWKPGSLGGVAAFCKAYTPDGYELIVDGFLVKASNEFIERFSDECWAAIESLDYWATQILDLHRLSVLHPSLAIELGEKGGTQP